jgi:hypothetical protein
MSKTVILNSNNYVQGSSNTFTYKFPTDFSFDKGSKIGLQSMSIYNSTFNISPELGNDTFIIIWNANITTTYYITIPPGYYTGDDLNYYMQNQFVARKLYMTATNGTNYVYFTEIKTNSIRYAFQINTFALPTSAQAIALGYTMPTGAEWSLPTTSRSPQITFCAGLGVLLGITTYTFPPISTVSTSQSYLSNIAPIISPINSYILTLSLLNSKYSSPNNIFYSIPLNKGFGDMIEVGNSNILYNLISPGRYSSLTITILDQNYKKVYLNDTEIVLVLSILEE